MSIFDRLGRLARSEGSELKRVLREADEAESPQAESEEAEHRRFVAQAEAELARDEEDSLASEIETGAAAWGSPRPEGAGDLARGAEAWAQATPRAETRPGRTHSFPREVREAYAALELPLGAPREAIETSFRALVARYHPDRHAQTPHLLRAATELTTRIRAARDLLLAWLGGA